MLGSDVGISVGVDGAGVGEEVGSSVGDEAQSPRQDISIISSTGTQ